MEQYRVVEQLIGCIQEVDSETGEPICNSKVCPVMSAGRYVSLRAILHTMTNKSQSSHIHMVEQHERTGEGAR